MTTATRQYSRRQRCAMTVGALVPVLAAAALILSSGRPAAAAEAASLANAYNASAAEVLPHVFDDEGNALVSPVSLRCQWLRVAS